MNSQPLTKELTSQLVKIEGECRGATIETDWDYIFHQKGQSGINKLEAKMASLGYPLKYKQIKTLSFYPLGLEALSMLAIKKLFNLSDQEFEEMGALAVQHSFLMKVFLKYFVSLELISEQIPKIWHRHYSIGDLNMSEFSQKKRYAILMLKNFPLPPSVHNLYWAVFRGFYSKVTQIIVQFPVTCQDSDCKSGEKPCRQFLLKW